MASTSHLSFNEEGDEYQVHPTVIFTILDAHKRRPPTKDSEVESRVVGTLLGERVGKKVHIKECFPVPLVEHKDQADFNTPHHDAMVALAKRVNPNIEVVGWFSTGSNRPSYVSSLIHQEYAERCLPHEAVFLTVNTTLKNNRLGIFAYRAKVIKQNRKDVQVRYDVAPLTLHAYEAEKIGMDLLINDNPESSELDAPATINSDNAATELALEKLRENLDTIFKYLVAVKAGKLEQDNEIGRLIQEAVYAVPRLDSASFDKNYNSQLEDMLLVVHLASLSARAQLDLADKITALLQ